MNIKATIIRMVILLFISTNFCSGQSQSIPEDWLGTWSGTLDIFSGPNVVQSIPMKLTIDTTSQTNIWKYFIQYGPEESGLRPYYLKRLDAEGGKYVLDEKNGIEISTYRLGHRLVSQFDVMQSSIQTTVYLSEHELIYEILAGPTDPVSISGDTIMQSDTIPPVFSYRVTTMQRAILTKE